MRNSRTDILAARGYATYVRAALALRTIVLGIWSTFRGLRTARSLVRQKALEIEEGVT
jgi:hypothetical protein